MIDLIFGIFFISIEVNFENDIYGDYISYNC